MENKLADIVDVLEKAVSAIRSIGHPMNQASLTPPAGIVITGDEAVIILEVIKSQNRYSIHPVPEIHPRDLMAMTSPMSDGEVELLISERESDS